ncbi:MAG: hypothetical protein PBU99_17700 [Klebsiella pneumoniae]
MLTIGHVGADFITLAAMLRIPVCMHNVEEAKIYRPSAWPHHGYRGPGLPPPELRALYKR